MKFKHTRKAIQKYDEKESMRHAAWDAAETDADVLKVKAMELEHLSEVRKAFYKDTKGINCLDNCMIATIDHMRKCVEGDK